MIRQWLLLACASIAFSATATPPTEALQHLPNVAFPAPGRIASGRLQASDMAALQAAGVREVIDLSLDSETPDFDEAAAMQRAGITYHNLPIAGAGDLNTANVKRFDHLLADAGSKQTLVHCASGNRVGALIALRAATLGGQSVDQAIAEGRRWGLKSLEPAVRAQLQSSTTSHASH